MSEPSIPDYSDRCVTRLMSALLAPEHGSPEWMPEEATSASRVALLVLDGLGWHQLAERASVAPTLSAASGRAITTVAPTTTVSALTSITTGATPGEHGMVGYRMRLGESVVQMLRWGDDHSDARRRHPPDTVQPVPPFLGARVPVLSRAEFEGTAFTEAHLRGRRSLPWRAASSIGPAIRSAMVDGDRFVYAYYDGVDKIAHERGFGAYYDAELAAADRLVESILGALPPDAALVVTADHGQVEVGEALVELHPEVAAHVAFQSGEGRFRWLHARQGSEGALAEVARARHGDVAWVRTLDETITEGWFGPVVREENRRRLGDVAIVPFEPIAFVDPAEGGGHPLVCRHGSLTPAEVEVPLLAFRGRGARLST
jgi:predicted AlkP superfamily pyrophosphatase or phosphodiesterase